MKTGIRTAFSSQAYRTLSLLVACFFALAAPALAGAIVGTVGDRAIFDAEGTEFAYFYRLCNEVYADIPEDIARHRAFRITAQQDVFYEASRKVHVFVSDDAVAGKLRSDPAYHIAGIYSAQRHEVLQEERPHRAARRRKCARRLLAVERLKAHLFCILPKDDVRDAFFFPFYAFPLTPLECEGHDERAKGEMRGEITRRLMFYWLKRQETAIVYLGNGTMTELLTNIVAESGNALIESAEENVTRVRERIYRVLLEGAHDPVAFAFEKTMTTYNRGLRAEEGSERSNAYRDALVGFTRLAEGNATHPFTVRARYYAGLTALRMGDVKAARKAFHNVRKTKAFLAENAILFEAYAYLSEGNYRRALSRLQTLVRDHPASYLVPHATTIIARVLAKEDNRDEAVALLTAYCDEHPEDDVYYEHMTELRNELKGSR